MLSHKECIKGHCSKGWTYVMLRNNKSKDDLACDPKAIVFFDAKGLQDPRDYELAETCL